MVYFGVLSRSYLWRTLPPITETIDSSKVIVMYGTTNVISGYKGPLIEVKRVARTGNPAGNNDTKKMWPKGASQTVDTVELKAFADAIGVTGIDVFVIRVFNMKDKFAKAHNKTSMVSSSHFLTGYDDTTRIKVVDNNVATRYMLAPAKTGTGIWEHLRGSPVHPLLDALSFSMFTMYRLPNGYQAGMLFASLLTDSINNSFVGGNFQVFLGGIPALYSINITTLTNTTDVVYTQYDKTSTVCSSWLKNETLTTTANKTFTPPATQSPTIQAPQNTVTGVEYYLFGVVSNQLTTTERATYRTYMTGLY